MDFMTSLFGSESTGKPRARRKVRVDRNPTSPSLEVNGLRGKHHAEKADGMVGDRTSLPPEDEEGNVEYKLKLVNPSANRLQHLVTQLKWRLREGQGEAIYEIGVEDNGVCTGLSDPDLDASLNTLKTMAKRLDATITVLRERDVTPEGVRSPSVESRIRTADKDSTARTGTSSASNAGPWPRRRVIEVLVRKVPENQQFLDLRIAVLGCADAGKSTLLGVLTQGEMDNGRGKARLNLFRHLHEVQTGRTSSISLEIVGFDSDGNLINHQEHSVEEICENSTKLTTFIDLAGHQKYLKTTIFGLTSYKPHFAMLVVAANIGVAGTTREHLGLATALEMPLFVVVTKIDAVGWSCLERTLSSIENVIKGPGSRKTPIRVYTDDDVISATGRLENLQVVPIILVSNVSGKGMERLSKFLNLLPPSLSASDKTHHIQHNAEFHIDEIFNVSEIGVVTAGLLYKGVIQEGAELLAGPDRHGAFFPVKVDSVHRNKAPVRVVQAGQAASIALGEMEGLSLRRGMVLVAPSASPIASMAFEAEVFLLYHPSLIVCIGFQTTVHIGNVRQTATIVDIKGRPCLKAGETAKVHFLFLQRPEYLTIGSRMLFREGMTKGIGQVTRIALDPTELPNSRSKTF